MRPYNPTAARRHGLGFSRFARHYSGNHYYFLFLCLLRCFSSAGWLSLRSDTPSVYQVVPFGNLRIYSLCAAPRSLSQLTTSFIASQTQGIHHVPLFALKKLDIFLVGLPTIFIVTLGLQLYISQYVKELFDNGLLTINH